MNPLIFLNEVALPNVADALDAPDSLRATVNAVLTLDALVGVLHAHMVEIGVPGVSAAWDDDTVFRGKLVKKEPAYEVLRDAAFALKHGGLKSKERQVQRASDIQDEDLCLDDFRVDDELGGSAIASPKGPLRDAIAATYALLKAEIDRLPTDRHSDG